MARRGFGAAYAVAPLDAVEVHLEDPLFRPEQLDQAGKPEFDALAQPAAAGPDRKSTRLNSSHSQISHALFRFKKKKHRISDTAQTRSPCIDRFLRSL